MEFIFEFIDQVKVLYMCGYSFDEAVEIANRNDDQAYYIKERCINLYFGPFEHSDFSLIPNYMEETLTEEEIIKDAAKDFRKHFTRKFEESLEESPLQGVTVHEEAALPGNIPADEGDAGTSHGPSDEEDDEELPF